MRAEYTLRPSFTLIELLLVVGIMGALSAIVITAISPKKQLLSAMDATRNLHVRELRNAISQAIIGGETLPFEITGLPTDAGTPLNICAQASTDQDECVSLTTILKPKYLSAIPQDPAIPESCITGYGAYRGTGDRIQIVAKYLKKSPDEITVTECAEEEVDLNPLFDPYGVYDPNSPYMPMLPPAPGEELNFATLPTWTAVNGNNWSWPQNWPPTNIVPAIGSNVHLTAGSHPETSWNENLNLGIVIIDDGATLENGGGITGGQYVGSIISGQYSSVGYMSGGEFYGPVTMKRVISYTPSFKVYEISGGTFYNTVTIEDGIIAGGTFDNEVTCIAADCSLSPGWIHGSISLTPEKVSGFGSITATRLHLYSGGELDLSQGLTINGLDPAQIIIDGGTITPATSCPAPIHKVLSSINIGGTTYGMCIFEP